MCEDAELVEIPPARPICAWCLHRFEQHLEDGCLACDCEAWRP